MQKDNLSAKPVRMQEVFLKNRLRAELKKITARAKISPKETPGKRQEDNLAHADFRDPVLVAQRGPVRKEDQEGGRTCKGGTGRLTSCPATRPMI